MIRLEETVTPRAITTLLWTFEIWCNADSVLLKQFQNVDYGRDYDGMLTCGLVFSAQLECTSNQAGMLWRIVSELTGIVLKKQPLLVICTHMLRLPANTIRPLFNSTLLRSSLRRAPISNSRFFSNGLVQCVRREPSKFQISLPRGSRTIMTDRPIVQEANSFSWKKLAMTAVSGVQYVIF